MPFAAPDGRVLMFIELVKRAYDDWSYDNATRLGASLAFYTLFSLAPLVLVVMAIVGLVFGPDAAKGLVFEQLRRLVGSANAHRIQDVIRNFHEPSLDTWAGAAGLATIFFGAMGVVGELQASLNQIWDVPPRRLGWRTLVRSRLVSLASVLGAGFMLLVSLALNAGASAAGKYLEGVLPIPVLFIHLANVVASFAVIALVFAMIFKFLPDAKIRWRDVWIGAIVTASLFTVGNFLLGLYLGKSGPASAYGAAGSLVLILLWTYYCAQIVYFGAEFTHVYAVSRGFRPAS